MSDPEQRIRELAYRLWEEAGHPHGRDDDFWHAARELIAAQDAEPPAGGTAPPEPTAPAPAASPAPGDVPVGQAAKKPAAKAVAMVAEKLPARPRRATTKKG